MQKPQITVTAQSMIYAQAARLTRTQRASITAWADDVEARRLARGVDAEDARPETFQAPVVDSIGVLIGHIAYTI